MRLVDDKKPERLQNKHLIHDSETNRRRATRHGFYYEPWYSSYKSMMERCYHPKCRQYEQYGGRGIKICEEWHNINAFAEWVKTSGYEKGLSIDRINVNGDYCPENCRWATSKEQANNRRNNVFYEYKGESHTLAEWARITGINRYTLWSRINKQGWTIEMALSDRQDAVPVVRKPVPDYEGYYEVDNLGRVFSVDRIIQVNDNGRIYDKPVHGAILKQTNHSRGYKTVALTKYGKTKQEYVHRIVASAFIPNPDNLPVVNHKDEDKTNNFVENLEWCTVSYNNTYGEKTKKQAEKIRGIPHTEDHKEKIANSLKKYYKTHVSASIGRKSEKRKPISQFNLDGNFIREYPSIHEASNGIISRRRNITAVCNGKRKSAYGYVWRWSQRKIETVLPKSDEKDESLEADHE